MRNILISACVTLSVLGCGGGGGDPVPTPTDSTQATTLCGVDVGNKRLTGLVTDVHDGDSLTLTIAGAVYKIRLDSIDAPELAQAFGDESQRALEQSVLGKTVKVAYSKTDQYDRIVGTVFTDTCQHVNLNQVASGMAWFYKAYQCEISSGLRSQFALAQDSAVTTKLGLWSQTEPEAPWFYRNGVEPVTPACASDASSGDIGFALTSVGATTAANSASIVPSADGHSSLVCYTGPSGGTYTLTANGNKNYSGC